MTTGRHAAPRNSYLRSVIHTAGTSFTSTALGAVTGLIIARLLGSDGRGTYAAITAFTTTTAVFCECGLTTSVCYHVAHRRNQAADVVRTGTWMISCAGVLAAAIGCLLAPVLLHGHPGGTTALRLAFLAEPVAFLGGVWASALQATNIRACNLVMLTQPVCYTAILCGTVSLGRVDVLHVVLALVISLVLQCLVALAARRRNIAHGGRFRARLARPLLRYGAVNLTARAPYLVNARFDQLMLALVAAPGTLGNYSVAVSLSLLAYPLAVAFGTVALPRVAAGMGPSGVVGQGILTSAVLGSLVIGATAAAALCAAAPFVVPALLGPSFGEVSSLLLLLAPGTVLFTANKPICDILRGFDQAGKVAVAEGIAALVTVVFVVGLVPVAGARAAAAGSSIAYATSFCFLLRALLRHTQVSARAAARRTWYVTAAIIARPAAAGAPGAALSSEHIRPDSQGRHHARRRLGSTLSGQLRREHRGRASRTRN
jgi:O-antigen/teichoic acid export membrane protein